VSVNSTVEIDNFHRILAFRFGILVNFADIVLLRGSSTENSPSISPSLIAELSLLSRPFLGTRTRGKWPSTRCELL
jgi:hypothetical protein